MSNRRLPVITDGPTRLGVLSIHLDGKRCRVGCEFCYLGDRIANDNAGALDEALLAEIIARVEFTEVAVAVSEPVAPSLPTVRAIVAAARARGKPVAITTTASVLGSFPALADGVSRVNLSIDPRKGPVAPAFVGRLARSLRSPGRQLALIVSLSTPEFARQLLDGDLRDLIELPHVDQVALNALKPPPPWCDRAFWLSACAELAPLLARHLDRKLFLDCYVAARILHLGGCPARPDVSPGNEFRACVYQPAPDFRFRDADDLQKRLAGFVAPAACPFPIP